MQTFANNLRKHYGIKNVPSRADRAAHFAKLEADQILKAKEPPK